MIHRHPQTSIALGKFYHYTYRKVASSSMSRLVAHLMIFRRLMKGKFDAYVVWPLAKKFQNWIVDQKSPHCTSNKPHSKPFSFLLILSIQIRCLDQNTMVPCRTNIFQELCSTLFDYLSVNMIYPKTNGVSHFMQIAKIQKIMILSFCIKKSNKQTNDSLHNSFLC